MGKKEEGYGWAISAGINAALAAIAAKFFYNQWFAGALLIVIGVVILSKSSVEPKANID